LTLTLNNAKTRCKLKVEDQMHGIKQCFARQASSDKSLVWSKTEGWCSVTFSPNATDSHLDQFSGEKNKTKQTTTTKNNNNKKQQNVGESF
jgi:hypothetical protein